MRYLLIIMSFMLCLNADVFEKVEDKNFSKEDIKKMNQIFTLDGSIKLFPELEEMFIAETGDKNYRKYLQEAVRDEDWRKANYSFNFMKKEGSFVVYENQKIDVPTPEYELGLYYYAKSADKGNVLAAYQGFKILEKYFMYMGANKITKQYLGFFTKKLMEKNYCIGYLYYARSINGDYIREPDHNEIKKILDKGRLECSKEGLEPYYLRGINHEAARNNVLIKIKSKRGTE